MATNSDDIKWEEIGYAVDKILESVRSTEQQIKQALIDAENAIKLAFGSADTVEPLIAASENRIKDKIAEASTEIQNAIPADDISTIKELATICKENILSETHGLEALKEAIENGSIDAIIEAKNAIIDAIGAVETSIQEMIDEIPLVTTADRAKADISGNPIESTYATIDYTDQSYANSNAYTDTKIAALINSAPETLDTLGEIAAAMAENATVVEALNLAIGSKANAAELDTHVNNSTIHMTATEKQNIADQLADLDERVDNLGEITDGISGEVLGQIEDQLDELKNSVSDGKTAVANAITDMGVTTATNSSFATLATNVKNITPTISISGQTVTASNNGVKSSTETIPYGELNAPTASQNNSSNLQQLTLTSSVKTPGYIDGSKGTTAIYTMPSGELNNPSLSQSGATVTATASVKTAGYLAAGTSKSASTTIGSGALNTPSISWSGATATISDSVKTAGYLAAGTSASTTSTISTNGGGLITPTTSTQTLVTSGSRVYFSGTMIVNSLGGNATAADVLAGKTFSSDSAGRAVTGTLSAITGSPIWSGYKSAGVQGGGTYTDIDGATGALMNEPLDIRIYYSVNGSANTWSHVLCTQGMVFNTAYSFPGSSIKITFTSSYKIRITNNYSYGINISIQIYQLTLPNSW